MFPYDWFLSNLYQQNVRIVLKLFLLSAHQVTLLMVLYQWATSNFQQVFRVCDAYSTLIRIHPTLALNPLEILINLQNSNFKWVLWRDQQMNFWVGFIITWKFELHLIILMSKFINFKFDEHTFLSLVELFSIPQSSFQVDKFSHFVFEFQIHITPWCLFTCELKRRVNQILSEIW